MEALYTLRFLKTQRDRLRVLHYINAYISLLRRLLRDEEVESNDGPGCDPIPTRASKPFTCPVELANSESAQAAAAGDAPPGSRRLGRDASVGGAAVTNARGFGVAGATSGGALGTLEREVDGLPAEAGLTAAVMTQAELV